MSALLRAARLGRASGMKMATRAQLVPARTLASSTGATARTESRWGKAAAATGVVLASATLAAAAGAQFAQAEGKVREDRMVMTSKFTYFSGRQLADPSAVRVFAGTGNPELAEAMSKYLGAELGDLRVSKFADGEVSIKVNENVRGKHVVLVQSCSPPNVNDALMELLLLVSTMRRSSAKTITVVMPYCAYARADSKADSRSPIAARDTMQMLETMGMDRLVVVDMHSGQMQGFLSPAVPSDNISAIKVGALYFAEKAGLSESNLVVVAPNATAVPRTKDFWNVLLQRGFPEARFAMVLRKPALGDAQRKLKSSPLSADPSGAGSNEYEVVGDDAIQGSDAIIVQDIIDSAEGLCDAAAALKENGAKRVFVFATHGIFSERALELINESLIDKVLVSNTVSCAVDSPMASKIEWISVAPLLAETVRRICEKESLSPLFKLPPI